MTDIDTLWARVCEALEMFDHPDHDNPPNDKIDGISIKEAGTPLYIWFPDGEGWRPRFLNGNSMLAAIEAAGGDWDLRNANNLWHAQVVFRDSDGNITKHGRGSGRDAPEAVVRALGEENDSA